MSDEQTSHKHWAFLSLVLLCLSHVELKHKLNFIADTSDIYFVWIGSKEWLWQQFHWYLWRNLTCTIEVSLTLYFFVCLVDLCAVTLKRWNVESISLLSRKIKCKTWKSEQIGKSKSNTERLVFATIFDMVVDKYFHSKNKITNSSCIVRENCILLFKCS